MNFGEASMIPMSQTVGDLAWIHGETISQTIDSLAEEGISLWGGTPARVLSTEEAKQLATKNPDNVWTGQ